MTEKSCEMPKLWIVSKYNKYDSMILYHTHNQQQFVNYEEMAKKKWKIVDLSVRMD